MGDAQAEAEAGVLGTYSFDGVTTNTHGSELAAAGSLLMFPNESPGIVGQERAGIIRFGKW